ncbi:MAG: SGNH/GDSL hydrolase family protein [Clostridia bacterium]|nr:SGNH/GDSL hydrolase family protein [Clostridia bacterium]
MIKTVMFTGDSITDCGRTRPVGCGSGQLGDSYVGNIFVQTWANDPCADIKFYNSATSGDTSRRLRGRWNDEVLAYPADYIFIMIGVNDCWREFDAQPYEGNAPSPEEYRDNIKYMIETSLAANSQPVLVSPYFLDLNKNDGMRAKCDTLNGVLRDLAKQYDLDYIDVQSVMDAYLEKASSYYLSGDRVHPKAIGRQIIARTIQESPVWKRVLAEAKQ